MDAYNQYMNLVGGLLNLNNIIIIVLMTMALAVGISIIKYRMNIAIIKRSVKEAIKELEAEKEKKLKEFEEEKAKRLSELAAAANKEQEKKLSEESAKILN